MAPIKSTSASPQFPLIHQSIIRTVIPVRLPTPAPMADPNSHTTSATKMPQTISLEHLSRDDLIQLVGHALQQYPDFSPIVQTAVTRASVRPKVDFALITAEFDDELHSLDDATDKKQFYGSEAILDHAYEMINKVAKSVDTNTPHEFVHEAFCCLEQFADSIANVNHESHVYELLEDDNTIAAVARAMKSVGKLLKAKGGTTDDTLKEKIWDYADVYPINGFDEVYVILWGEEDTELEDDDEEEAEEDDEEEEEEDQVPAPKRARR
jgi:hypothetical protein